MADTLKLQIMTPEKLVLEAEASMVQIPAKEGYIGVLPGHAALLSELGEGDLHVETATGRHQIPVSGGYLEIRDDQIRVLADSTEGLVE